MRRSAKREPIPWDFEQGNHISTWVWDTEDFRATIIAEGASPNHRMQNPDQPHQRRVFSWRVADKISSPGNLTPLDSAMGGSFGECEDELVETIAKAYPKHLGYDKYAGNLATIFTISKRRSYDFAQFIGKKLTVHVYTGDGEERTEKFKGVFDISGYEFTVRNDEGDMVYITPTSIADLFLEFGGKSGLEILEEAAKTTPRGTTFYEPWRPGCSGKEGYQPGTVTHSPADSYCFLHHV